MNLTMEMPKTWAEYEEVFGISDTEQIYTNGSKIIPCFRVREWLEYIENRPKAKWIAVDTPKGYVQEYKCSNCGAVTEDFAYCPMCGAMMFDEESVMPELDMRGEE